MKISSVSLVSSKKKRETDEACKNKGKKSALLVHRKKVPNIVNTQNALSKYRSSILLIGVQWTDHHVLPRLYALILRGSTRHHVQHTPIHSKAELRTADALDYTDSFPARRNHSAWEVAFIVSFPQH